jgi:hypothetical protein
LRACIAVVPAATRIGVTAVGEGRLDTKDSRRSVDRRPEPNARSDVSRGRFPARRPRPPPIEDVGDPLEARRVGGQHPDGVATELDAQRNGLGGCDGEPPVGAAPEHGSGQHAVLGRVAAGGVLGDLVAEPVGGPLPRDLLEGLEDVGVVAEHEVAVRGRQQGADGGDLGIGRVVPVLQSAVQAGHDHLGARPAAAPLEAERPGEVPDVDATAVDDARLRALGPGAMGAGGRDPGAFERVQRADQPVGPVVQRAGARTVPPGSRLGTAAGWPPAASGARFRRT